MFYSDIQNVALFRLQLKKMSAFDDDYSLCFLLFFIM